MRFLIEEKENYHFSHDVGAGFARAVIDSFSGYGVFNLLGQTKSVDEFLEIIKEQKTVGFEWI